jgi:hypothetical protein
MRRRVIWITGERSKARPITGFVSSIYESQGEMSLPEWSNISFIAAGMPFDAGVLKNTNWSAQKKRFRCAGFNLSLSESAMIQYECPKRLYKYLSINGLIKTLEHGSIRLSRPAEFNDPLDMYLQAALGEDRISFLEGVRKAFLENLWDDNDLSSMPSTPSKDKLVYLKSAIKHYSEEQKALLREGALNIPIDELYDIARLDQSFRDVISFVNQSFQYDGVFCTTVAYNNLLMWAHYADKHQGAVVEFTPSIEEHSALLASKKVRYSNQRPVLFATAQEMALHTFCMSAEETGKEILDTLTYTKSCAWEYEQEYRLYIPFFIKPGQEFATLSFHPKELTSVFLGCRMGAENEEKTISLAKAINPYVAIYKASPTPREFSITFNRYQ